MNSKPGLPPAHRFRPQLTLRTALLMRAGRNGLQVLRQLSLLDPDPAWQKRSISSNMFELPHADPDKDRDLSDNERFRSRGNC